MKSWLHPAAAGVKKQKRVLTVYAWNTFFGRIEFEPTGDAAALTENVGSSS
jgi:hypothetical protein